MMISTFSGTSAAIADDATATGAAETEQTAMLYSFEPGLFNVRMPIMFGTITLNRDKKYVRSGEKSMKLCPGKYMQDPYMYLPLESTLLGFSYTDIMKIYAYRFSVYTEEVCDINVGLYFDKMANARSPEQKFVLSKGWNDIEYIPQYAVMNLQYDVTLCKGMYIMFKTQDEMPIVYVDDVQLVFSDVAMSPENLLILKRTETSFEICDFENAYQHLMFNSYVYGTALAPSISIVKAADYGLTAPSGNKVLRVELTDHTTPSYSWAKFKMVPALIEEVNLKQFVGHLNEYVLKFEVLRDFDLVGSTFENLVELNPYYNAYGAMDWAGTTVVGRGIWETAEFSLESFPNFINNPYSLEFAFIERGGNGSRVYYFDNFRIEKV